MHADFDRARRQDNRILFAVMLLVSLPFVLGAAYMAWNSAATKFGSLSTVGRVIEITGTTPTLVVRFRTDAGEAHELTSVGSDLYKNYRVGDGVRVYYDDARPADATLDLFVELWLIPILLGVFGMFFFVPAVFVGKGVLSGLFTRVNLDRDGQIVQAEYTGFRFTLDPKVLSQRPGGIGSVEIISENGKHRLIDNGRTRDPLDSAVQRELGLRFIVQARWKDPLTRREFHFASEPQIESPEERVRSNRVAVRINPKDPAQYRFEAPFGAAVG